MKQLCHHIRNATMSLSEHIKKIKSPADRLDAKKQLLRIEQALIKYEGRVKSALSIKKS